MRKPILLSLLIAGCASPPPGDGWIDAPPAREVLPHHYAHCDAEARLAARRQRSRLHETATETPRPGDEEVVDPVAVGQRVFEACMAEHGYRVRAER